ncbi:hypothetical protein [Nocardioides panzhihuensis]|uniref:Uncharacterized protein n=1 Tax=Nocardioides panzhihuensis TaxID=860243 RepID=A0A7Z0ITU9_9ACTN|nr:hypothetical protein [Nocardioides panzhihuensis]NYI79310.1 hypothetical protein [Nocardioides panzhihuensis]
MTDKTPTDQLFEAWAAFDTSLWEGNGLNPDALESVKAALAALKDEWSAQERVPKSVAALLIEMFPATEANAAAYRERGSSQASQIDEAAYELQQLIADALLE